MKMKKKFIEDPRFVECLRRAALTTAISGREAGFMVLEFQNQLYFGKSVKGECTHIGFEPSTTVFPSQVQIALAYEEARVVWEVHFHPGADGVILPSCGDLAGLFPAPPPAIPGGGAEAIGIGQISRSGDVYLLVVKRGTADRLSLQEVDEETKGFPDSLPSNYQDEANAILTRAGFEVELLSWPARLMRKKSSKGR